MNIRQHEYHKEVQALIPFYHSHDFDVKLHDATRKLPSSAKLIIKIELKRLMKPCNKQLDLRGKVQGDCRLYRLHDTQNWIDDIALNHYLRRIADYGGHFTQGLHEELYALPNNNRNIRDSAADIASSPNTPWLRAQFIEFGKNILRKESRFTLKIPVRMVLSDGAIVHGTTHNVSRSGLKLKMTSAFGFSVGDIVQVELESKINEASSPTQVSGFKYRITRLKEDTHSSHWVSIGLALVSPYDTESVTRLIQNKLDKKEPKRRFENDDKIENLRNRALENLVVRHTSTLPVYFAGNTPKAVFLNKANRTTWEYWHDDTGSQFLDQLFLPQRLEELKRQQELLFYCFTQHQKDKKYYLCAGSHELTAADRKMLCKIGAEKASFRVFKVAFNDVNGNEKKALPQHYQSISHIALVQDVTHQFSKDYLPSDLDVRNIKNLTPFTRHSTERSTITQVFDGQDLSINEPLKRILIGHLFVTRYFIAREGDALSFRAFGINSLDSFLNQLLLCPQDNMKMTAQPVFHNEFYDVLKHRTKRWGQKETVHQEFYIAKYNFGGESKIMVKSPADFLSVEQRIGFIADARRNGQFVAVRNTITPINGMLDCTDREELEALYPISNSKVRQLEREMDQMCIYGELTDITDEVLLRATLKIRQPLKDS
ncbi:hypothetical protein CS022_07515 [Veronia nyctiphanis]|uniref:PilZ domain-containing protein n=1 Tax=Veronia nyctiphanis TaxID=1278244 RepID=A0A4Q0YXB1_9GAMM|nr:PilZ domain-containing protein [Veronia nyctiphanis]RXJ73829.1 hypothetical protein CS022_07515 [Veronia nyctiphanis]